MVLTRPAETGQSQHFKEAKMFDLDKQKEYFKNHIATFTDYGNIKILDFKNPESSEYHIRFLFEEDYCRLHISGDLGSLVATNYNNMTYNGFSDFVNDIGYFEGKIDCTERDIYYYDEEQAKDDILNLIEEEDIRQDIIDGEYQDDDEESINEFISDVLTDFSDKTGISSDGYNNLSKYSIDAWNYAENIGKCSSHILDVYMLAFKLAQQSLKEQEEDK